MFPGNFHKASVLCACCLYVSAWSGRTSFLYRSLHLRHHHFALKTTGTSHRKVAAAMTPRSVCLSTTTPAATSSSSSSTEGRREVGGPSKTVILQAGKAKLFWDGNSLIYGGAVDKVQGNPVAGEYVSVVDSSKHRNLIGYGVYNDKSSTMYRCRILWHAREKELSDAAKTLEGIITRRIQEAYEVRKACQLPNEETTAYRLVHAEGDRLSGLVVDIYDHIAVVSSSALYLELHREMITMVIRSVLKDSIDQVVWRRSEGRLQQDGWSLSKEEKEEERREKEALLSQGNHVVWVKELGVKYSVNVLLGQKSGFYTDQRETRRVIRGLAKGKKVLDLYTYTGAFAMNAVLGGAASVIGVDSSRLAIATARENAEANNISSEKIIFVQAECYQYMLEAKAKGEVFDCLICDPPKLSPQRSDLKRAIPKYTKLNAAALALVKKEGGLLLTCTCSAAVQVVTFMEIIKEASVKAGRSVSILRIGGAALDHVSNPSHRESEYLTTVLLAVH